MKDDAPKTSVQDRAFFDAIARRYDRVYALTGDASKKTLARALEIIKSRPRVLVLGVGTGRELSPLLDAGHTPIGLDFSREMLALCNNRSRKVPLVEADFWAPPLPFDDASFDAVTALHGTLAHAPEPEADSLRTLARELARITTKDSPVVIEIPTTAMIPHLPETYETDDGRHMSANARGELVHEDTVTGAKIFARLLAPEIYARAFEPEFAVMLEPMDRGEMRVIAVRC